MKGDRMINGGILKARNNPKIFLMMTSFYGWNNGNPGILIEKEDSHELSQTATYVRKNKLLI